MFYFYLQPIPLNFNFIHILIILQKCLSLQKLDPIKDKLDSSLSLLHLLLLSLLQKSLIPPPDLEKTKTEILSCIPTLDLSVPCLNLNEMGGLRGNWLDERLEKVVFKGVDKEQVKNNGNFYIK